MSNSIKIKGQQFADFLKTLSQEEIEHGNAVNLKSAEDEFRRFTEHFDVGECYLCKKPLASFSKKHPCPHWLLRPSGFKKKDIIAIAEHYGFIQIQAFLRWVANHDSFAKNINDLKIEERGTKLFEVTIRWKHLEWAFSCAESDYQGHETSQHFNYPHYHFQMRQDKHPFINYNDFHLPFSEMDIINIEAVRAHPDLIRQRYPFGEGMADVLCDEELEYIITSTEPIYDEDEDEGTFRLNSIAIAEEGKTLDGNELNMLIQEAKAKGVTVASLFHKLQNANTQIIVSPGPGVVEQAPRGGQKSDI